MLKINVLCVGDYKEQYWRDAQNEYLKRLSRFFNVETLVLKESTKEKESSLLLSKMSGYCILLDIAGEVISSEKLSQKIDALSQTNSKLTFIIGGSEGVSEEVKQKVNERVSFGKITLPHQLARVVLLEQLYRSATISNNIKYHK